MAKTFMIIGLGAVGFTRSWHSIFVSLQWVKNAFPAIGGIEDRHIEDKHRIVNLSPTQEDFSPVPLRISAQSFNFQTHFD